MTDQKGDVFTYGAPKDWEPQTSTRAREAYDFFLKEGTEAVFIGLDDKLVRFHEHRLSFKKKEAYPQAIRKDLFTCPKAGCPLCLNEDFDYYEALATTILDCREYKRNDGSIIPVSRKLLRTKSDMAKALNDLYHSCEKDLRGIKVKVRRTGGMKPAVGDQWLPFPTNSKGTVDLSKRTDVAAIIPYMRKKYPNWSPPDDLIVAIDYPTVLAPLALEQLEKIGRGEVVGSADRSEGPTGNDGLDFDALGGSDGGSEESTGKDDGGAFDLGDLPF